MPRTVGNLVVYDLPEVAEMLRLHLDTLRRYIREGRLRAAKAGKTYLVTEENLQEFLKGTTIRGMLLDLRKTNRRSSTVAYQPERRVAERRKQDIFHPASEKVS